MSNTFTLVRSQNPQLFDAVLWTHLAVNPQDPRPFCGYLHLSVDNNLLATDGHRLHLVNLQELGFPGTPGVYHLARRGRYKVDLRRLDVPGTDPAHLPRLAFELIDQGRKYETVNWARAPGNEESLVNDLFGLIAAVVKLDLSDVRDRGYGLNPWYLADALEQTGDVVRITGAGDRIYLAGTPSNTIDVGPLHEALVMGFRR